MINRQSIFFGPVFFEDLFDGVGGGQAVPASVDGLQKGLVEILSEPAQLKSMGANLKKYVFEHFTWDVVIEKYLSLYHKILDTGK